MIQKRAVDLKVGEVFCREHHQPQNPRRDMLYTVKGMQFIPLRNFYGQLVETVQVTAENHLLGPATVNMGGEELVWVFENGALSSELRPAPPPPEERSRRFRFRR